MAKINGSEARIAIKKGVAHGTAVALTGANGMAFDSLEWNDNPETLEFSTKGLGRSMKSHLQLGRMAPNLTLNYKLKYAGKGMELLCGLFGNDSAPSEATGGQGDYARIIYYSNDINFYTIAVQSTSTTSIEWASCYPSSATITYNSFQPVEVSINFVTTPRNNTPATNTYAYISSNVTISDSTSSWVVFDQASRLASNDTGSGSLPDSHTYDVQSITFDIQKNWEVTNEVTGTAVTGAPNRTGLFMVTMTTTHSGLEDHTFMNLYTNETSRAFQVLVNGEQIGSGVNERISFYIPASKLISDVSAPITNDGFNPVTLNWEAYIDSNRDGTYDQPFLYIANKDSGAYV